MKDYLLKIKIEANKIGKASNPSFICMKVFSKRNKHGKLLVLVQEKITKEKKITVYSQILRGSNPFKYGKILDLQIKEEINKLGKKSFPSFICLNSRAGKTKTGIRRVTIQEVKTKENKTVEFSSLQKQTNPFRCGKFRDFMIFKEINKIGLKNSPKFTCLNPKAGKTKSGARLIVVQDSIVKEKKIVSYSDVISGKNPFSNGIAKDFYIMKEINKMGKKTKPNFICLNLDIMKSGMRFATVQDIKTKEKKLVIPSLLKKGYNPFLFDELRKKSDLKLKEEFNTIGLNSSPAFKCLSLNGGKSKCGGKKAIIQNLITKEKKIVFFSSLKNKCNPFLTGKYRDSIVKKDLDKIGLFSSPKFKCINPNYKISKTGNKIVIIQNLKTKEKKKVQYGNLITGHNPFNENQKRIELTHIHPLYMNLFKKHGIKYYHNYRLGSKILDFAFDHPLLNKRFGLEVKQSDKWHSKKGQLNLYKKLSSLKQYSLSKVILSDPKGNHRAKGSISIKELEIFLTK